MAIDSVKLGYILKNFVTATADVEGVAVVTPDGL
ncbi:MAG TPA: diacylglyceryl transferase, partial [Cyanophyceae cyanobacterium]